MTNLKQELATRKYTTKKALKKLETLIAEINGSIEDDLDCIVSKTFPARVSVDNDHFYTDIYYRGWKQYESRFEIENGELKLISIGEEEPGMGVEHKEVKVTSYESIDFSKMIEALNEALTKYNDLSVKKDIEIENFLSLISGGAK